MIFSGLGDDRTFAIFMPCVDDQAGQCFLLDPRLPVTWMSVNSPKQPSDPVMRRDFLPNAGLLLVGSFPAIISTPTCRIALIGCSSNIVIL